MRPHRETVSSNPACYNKSSVITVFVISELTSHLLSGMIMKKALIYSKIMNVRSITLPLYDYFRSFC